MEGQSAFWRRWSAALLVVGLGPWWSGCVHFSAKVEVGEPEPQTEEERLEIDVRVEKLDWKEKLVEVLRDGAMIVAIAQAFELYGPVKGEAPLVVDFELETKGHLRVEIELEEGEPRHVLRFDGRKGKRKVGIETLPAELGEWRAARLFVSAFEDAAGERPIDFDFFGIGVGERAAGSTGIYDVQFKPGTIRRDQPATYRFRSRHDFEKARIRIYRGSIVGREHRDTHIRSMKSACLPERGTRCEGTWDGRDEHGERSSGPYRVGVVAWQSQVERDWILELSKDTVEVK